MIKAEQFYKEYLHIDPYEYQLKMWEYIKVYERSPLLLKAPTGSGKTEAVLAPFLSQFIDNKISIAPRMIYVLPMRVLVNSVAERIKKYAHRISPQITVEIQHGDAPNSPFFIADILVTTLDQFLYGFARASEQVGRHLDIPAGSIASSLVVFDEAHMYRDGFTFSIMRALMEILHKSHIPFVLMTATIPASLEKSLFENIKLSNDQKLIGDISNTGELKISLESNPLYSNNNVYISEELFEKIKSKKTLIVVNQVKRAQKVYEEVKSRLGLNCEQIVLLHSRFTKADRKKHEERAISLIPHKEDGKIIIPEKTGIVVSTQVLEAGIDFSAELLLTELSPADSIIQRAGRCARYNGQSGETIIFPVEEENREYLPYEREHLSKTLEWLQRNKQFNIKNFSDVCTFVDNTLDYKADDYEARDTLVDLYECVLYADNKPENIQLRKGKPVTLVVLDIPEGSGEKVRKEIEEIILQEKTPILKGNSINVDIGIAWSLFKDENRPIQWEIQWKYNSTVKSNEPIVIDLFKGKKEPEKEDSRICPFRTYIINKKYYTQDKGIYPDVSAII
jgi:CRISPR-associated endonuclease/helicase Cas3